MPCPSNCEPAHGHVVAVRGAVLDVVFDTGKLPALEEALSVTCDRRDGLIAEVQSHLDAHTGRAIALQDIAGLARGAVVQATGGSIAVPVGEAVLGRLPDVVGAVRDRGPALPQDTVRWPIHPAAPPLAAQAASRAV